VVVCKSLIKEELLGHNCQRMRETGQSRGRSQPIVRFEVKSLPQPGRLLCPKARLMGFNAPAP